MKVKHEVPVASEIEVVRAVKQRVAVYLEAKINDESDEDPESVRLLKLRLDAKEKIKESINYRPSLIMT